LRISYKEALLIADMARSHEFVGSIVRKSHECLLLSDPIPSIGTSLSALDLEFAKLQFEEEQARSSRDLGALPVFPDEFINKMILPPCRAAHAPRSAWAALFPVKEKIQSKLSKQEQQVPFAVTPAHKQDNKPPADEQKFAVDFWEGKEALARLVASELKSGRFGPGSECYAFIVRTSQQVFKEKRASLKSNEHDGFNIEVAIKYLLQSALTRESSEVQGTLHDKHTAELVSSILEKLPTPKQLDSELLESKIKAKISAAKAPIAIRKPHFKALGVVRTN
jgi:hypothetical protein